MVRIAIIFILLLQGITVQAQKAAPLAESFVIKGQDTFVNKYGGLIRYNRHPAEDAIKTVYIQVLTEYGSPDCCHMLVKANGYADNSGRYGDEYTKLPKDVVKELFGLLNYLDASHLKYDPGYYRSEDYTKVDITYANDREAHLFFSKAVSPAELLLIRSMAEHIYDRHKWQLMETNWE
jgi:hypothetical protein